MKNKEFMLRIAGFIVFLCMSVRLHAQDIEAALKSKWLETSGGVNLSGLYNHTTRNESYRLPLSYMFSGNINFRIKGIIDAPFTFLYSNLGSALTQPSFNQTAFHPRYKALQAHVGTIAASWSPYTVGGHVFSGAAVEYAPRNWNIAALYGRFVKATDPQGNVEGNVLPAFRRMGRGVRLGYRRQAGLFEATYFSAEDDAGSISPPLPQTGITAKANSVFGLKWQQKLLRNISFQFDGGLSRMQEDVRSPETLRSFAAFKSNLVFARKTSQWTLNYERVDPGYRTLGAYYFNNDLENISLGGNFSLLRKKLQIQSQAGLQRDNLNRSKWSSMLRQVGMLSVQYRPGKKTQIHTSWSNFLSYTNIRPYTDYQNQLNPLLSWDTLNFRQISSNLNVGAQTEISNNNRTSRRISLSAVHQNSADSRNGKLLNSNAFINAGLSYVSIQKQSGRQLSCSFFASSVDVAGKRLMNYSPVLSISGSVWHKKLKSAISASPSFVFQHSTLQNRILNLRWNNQLTLQKKHNLQLSCLWLHSSNNAKPPVCDLNVMLAYGMVLR